MTEQLKNILIGLFVVIAIVIGIAMILFLEPTVGDGKQIIHARFANIAGISVGTRVTFAGKPVGEVSEIETVPHARQEAVDELGRVYLYELTLKVDSGTPVYASDEIAIRTTGLMGERTIAILPKSPACGKPLELIDGKPIYANSVDPLENTVNQIAKVAVRVQAAVEHFDKWFVANEEPLSSAIRSFDSASRNASTVLGQMEQEEIIPSLKDSITSFTDSMNLVKKGLDEDDLLHKTATLITDFDKSVNIFNTDGAQTLRYMNQIARDLATGTGTLGRFLTSEDFYLRLSSIMGKVETLMNDINHYGILFQYDKSWQKNRTRKANFMRALETPSEFRSYFEGEVDTIQTALGRLTELLDRATDTDERQKIFQSEGFKRDFASLLRQVQALTDSIKLYNEELVAQSNDPVQCVD